MKLIHLCTVAALSVVVTAAPARSEEVPAAAGLLERMVRAYEELGAVSVRNTLEELQAGKVVSKGVQTVRRNDSGHYVTEFSEGRARMRLVANGDSLLVHNVTRNVYRLGRNYRVDLAMPFSRVRDEVAKALKDPANAAALARAVVSRAKVDGASVWRLDWPETVRLGPLPVRYLCVSVDDGLARQVMLQDSKGTLRATARYSRRKAPWPAKTFDVTPPKGATELPAPKT